MANKGKAEKFISEADIIIRLNFLSRVFYNIIFLWDREKTNYDAGQDLFKHKKGIPDSSLSILNELLKSDYTEILETRDSTIKSFDSGISELYVKLLQKIVQINGNKDDIKTVASSFGIDWDKLDKTCISKIPVE